MTFTATPDDGGVWITGASEGIGKAVAEQLAAEGFTVYASARSADKLAQMTEAFDGAGKIFPMPLDVTDRQACENCVKKIVAETGRLAVVLLNAGTFVPIKGKSLNFEAFDFTIDVNVNGVLNGLVPSIEVMKEAGGGQVGIVSSVAGYGGLPKNAGYGLTKAGLINMAESLKFDFDKLNIKIQIINPGFIDTPLTEKNEFPMPFLMGVDDAAKRIVQGLKSSKFELTFPRRFTFILKFLNLWIYPVYFWLVRKMTGA
ncbi:MAG: SDR family NAD(P)-dependent oxidoreductase [Pseudomonadota bacterium]